MGGDFAPDAAVRAAAALSRNTDIRVLLAGDERILEPALAAQGADAARVEILHAPDAIAMDEHPARRGPAPRHLARARDRRRRRGSRPGARLGGQHRCAAALRRARHPAPARRAPHRLRRGLPDAARARTTRIPSRCSSTSARTCTARPRICSTSR